MKELEAISRKVEEWRELGLVARNGLQCADELESLLSALAERITELDEAFKIAKQQMALALKGRVDADLKRQLAEAQAQVAVVDRALHDLGDTSAQAALDAHDAEVRNEALEEGALAVWMIHQSAAAKLRALKREKRGHTMVPEGEIPCVRCRAALDAHDAALREEIVTLYQKMNGQQPGDEDAFVRAALKREK